MQSNNRDEMTVFLGDLSSASEYRVRLAFTPPLDPSVLVQGMPFVSLLTEIEANSSTTTAAELRRQYGRIPYGSPLYWWETHSNNDVVTCVYIGRTVRQKVHKRFDTHAKVVRLLSQYVNSLDTRVMFRLCSRFDILYDDHRLAIEHLPPDQADHVVNDVEAWLIYENQPSLNVQHKRAAKKVWKPFMVEHVHFR